MNNRTLFTELDGLDRRPDAPPAPVSVAIVLIAVMLLALAGIVRLAQLRGSGELLARFTAPPATAGDYAYYTERYWQAATARDAALNAGRQASAGMSESEMYRELYARQAAEGAAWLARPPAYFAPGEFATYTGRYWQMAAAREAALLAASAPAATEYVEYADRYWQMAAARDAHLSTTSAAPGAPTSTRYASYTDQYWQMAADREVRLKLAALEP